MNVQEIGEPRHQFLVQQELQTVVIPFYQSVLYREQPSVVCYNTGSIVWWPQNLCAIDSFWPPSKVSNGISLNEYKKICSTSHFFLFIIAK